MFFKRLLQIAAQRTLELCQALSLDDEVKEKIWSIVKIQLSVETHLIVNRMVDQMVMCAIYGVCKVQPGLQITFNMIITKYAELFKNSRAVYNVYMQVYYHPEEKKDIINFYNDIFIKYMKEYIISMKPDAEPLGALSLNKLPNPSRTPVPGGGKSPLTPAINKPSIKALCPQSPL